MRKSAPLFCALLLSLSARRAWIEIICPLRGTGPAIVALRKESVDRNCSAVMACCSCVSSLSARRAWIEIRLVTFQVERGGVALRKESVDRNSKTLVKTILPGVALRKESVDRNVAEIRTQTAIIPSLSARRAWIEMQVVKLTFALQESRSPQGERG